MNLKRNLKKSIFSLFLILPIFLSCTKSPTKSVTPIEISGLHFEKSLPLKYAKEFRIDEYSCDENESALSGESLSSSGVTRQSSYLLTISENDRYLLVPRDFSVPENLPPKITVIRVPAKNVYLCASSAMAFWARLDSLSEIRFSSIKKDDWFIDGAKNAMEEGRILYAGKYNAPDFELLLKENCSLALESTMIYHAPQIKEKLESLGIPVFVDKSSYEENPLGRLEWVKVYGAMTGKLDEAEKFFDAQIEKIKMTTEDGFDELNHQNKESPKVAFFYINPSGLCITRGAEDYIAKMIEMAGGNYLAPQTKSKSPSVTVSFEQFYAAAKDADILIYNSSIDNSPKSVQDIIAKNSLFSDFKAVKNGSVWFTQSQIYQSSDRIADIILDLREIFEKGGEAKTEFLTR